MAMDARNVAFGFLIGLISLASFPPGVAAQNQPIVVQVFKTPHGIAYNVDSKRVDLTASENLLRLLAVASEKHGAHAPVVVLVDPARAYRTNWLCRSSGSKGTAERSALFRVPPDTEDGRDQAGPNRALFHRSAC